MTYQVCSCEPRGNGDAGRTDRDCPIHGEPKQTTTTTSHGMTGEQDSNASGAEGEEWYKHGPAFDAEANCDVWGISREPYDPGKEQVMDAWVFREADADRIIADHNAAAQLAAARADANALAAEVKCFFAVPCQTLRETYNKEHEDCSACNALAHHEALKSATPTSQS